MMRGDKKERRYFKFFNLMKPIVSITGASFPNFKKLGNRRLGFLNFAGTKAALK